MSKDRYLAWADTGLFENDCGLSQHFVPLVKLRKMGNALVILITV